MAEGLEIEFPPSSPRYFCHLCARRVPVAHPDLTCRICQSGFVEELSDTDSHREFGEDISDPPPDSDSEDSDTDIEGVSPIIQASLTDLIRRTIMRTMDFELNDGVSLQRSLESNGPRLIAGLSDPDRSGLSGERAILPFVAEVYGNMGLGLVEDFRDLQHFASNIGDYALGSEWDSIITQILNEAELSGPPPLDKAKIDELPMVSVEKEHVSKALQCTICMEDFKLAEKVKCLPCEHIFHTECIVPWLEMHATCPICRKEISS